MGGDVGGSSKSKSEPNVVPLCDILLVLLIIFMVVTPMIKKGANVKLPEATNTVSEPEPGKIVTVFLKQDGSIIVDGKVVETLDKLTIAIEDRMEETKQPDKKKLLLKADSDVTYGRVTEVMEEIRRAEIEIVGLISDASVKQH